MRFGERTEFRNVPNVVIGTALIRQFLAMLAPLEWTPTDSTMNDAHSDLVTICRTETGELNEWGNPEECGNELTYEEHYQGLAQKREFEGKALRLVCDECGGSTLVCPVCHGDGYFRGESTGKMLACHVCNTREYARQQREVY